MSKLDKRNKQLKTALEPLKEFEGYFDEKDDRKAKLALAVFFRQLEKIRTDKYFDLGYRQSYYSFYINLIPVMIAIQKEQYALACHEILTLEHHERILQKRVHSGLMFLYNNYLR